MKYLEVSLQLSPPLLTFQEHLEGGGGVPILSKSHDCLTYIHIVDASTGARSTCVTSLGNTSGYLDLAS